MCCLRMSRADAASGVAASAAETEGEISRAKSAITIALPVKKEKKKKEKSPANAKERKKTKRKSRRRGVFRPEFVVRMDSHIRELRMRCWTTSIGARKIAEDAVRRYGLDVW